MAKTPAKTKGATKTDAQVSASGAVASPLVDLRDEVDRLFDRFSTRFPSWPAGRNLFDWAMMGYNSESHGHGADSFLNPFLPHQLLANSASRVKRGVRSVCMRRPSGRACAGWRG